MKILLFDDRPDVRRIVQHHLAESLGIRGEDVLCCRDCSQVKSHLDTIGAKGFDRFIVDLNVPMTGLPQTMWGKAKDGLLTGWVLLTQIILPEDTDCLQRAIIYSGYLSNLEDYIMDEANAQEKKSYEVLKKRKALVKKSDGVAALDRLLR